MKLVLGLTAIVIGVALAANVVAAPRLVVGELFTNTYCGPCASFDPSLDAWNLANQADFVLVCYHGWWPGYGDVFWQADSVENRPRINYYGADYAPHFRMDGIQDLTSVIAPATWSSTLTSRQSISAPLTIALNATYNTGTRQGSVNAQITNVSGSTVSGNFILCVAESVFYHTGGGNGYDVNTATVRDYVPNHNGTPLTLTAGNSTSIPLNFTLPVASPPSPAIDPNRVQLIGFVQGVSHEIYQGARVFFPVDQPHFFLGAGGVSSTVLPGGDGDAYLDAGESGSTVVTVRNINQTAGTSVTGTISSSDPYVTILDGSASFGTIAAFGSASNSGDPFTYSIAPGAPSGYSPIINLTLSTGAVTYSQILTFGVDVGSPTDVTGPIGTYYAYENGDPYLESPTYSWVEIDPGLGGAGTQILNGDELATAFTLPFTFRYWGTNYTQVTASSNGWVAPGFQTADTAPSPSAIPSADGPFGIIAGFWADLNPAAAGSGKIFRYSDTANHRYIFEYNNVAHFDNPSIHETFEIIITDPAFNPTSNGDAEILMQFKAVGQAGAGVSGIENQAENVGIQYSYFGDPNPAAGGIVANRVVKYTPDASTRTSVAQAGAGGPMLLMAASPNPFMSATQLSFRLPVRQAATLRVYGVDGREVATLFSGMAEAGVTQARWNGLDTAGNHVAAGLYFARLASGGETQTGKVMVLR